MLAQPKRKTVWSINPRGKYWSEDKSKLGQKLLESMGWREGLGLGKHNNGIKDHIRLNPTSDNKGLGYKASKDVWVDKNEDYEQLLANLAVHHNNGSNRSEAKVSNLEETSKKHRNRLHYSKLIKSKNLSQCSEKDLISIFPKRRQISDQTNGEAIEETNSNSVEEVKTSDNTFESTTDMREYFKNKMNKLKLKSQTNEINSTKDEENERPIQQTTDEEITSQTEKPIQESSEGSLQGSDNSVNDSNSDSKQKKRKKKSKRSKEENSFVENSTNEEIESQTTEQNVTKDKPNKKHKKKKTSDPEITTEGESQVSTDSPKKSPKKRKSNTGSHLSLVPKGYNTESMSVSESLRNYDKICAAIERDRALNTTNLMSLKGYGCPSH